jgi:hypothetical protein
MMAINGATAAQVLNLGKLSEWLEGYRQRAMRRGNQRLAIAAANHMAALESRLLGAVAIK